MYLGPRLPIVVLVAGVAVAAVPGPAWATVLAALTVVAAAVVTDTWLAPHPASLRPRREVAGVLRLGRDAPVALHVWGPGSRPLEVHVRDATPPSMGRRPLRHRATLTPGTWTALPSEIHPTRRGHATLGPLTIRTAGPLRLAGRQATLPVVDRVKVYPALRGRAQVELRLERARLLQSGRRSSAYRGGGSDFESLREYRPDDEFRRINWRATARSTRTIANEYREEKNQQVVLVLDASRAMAGQVGGVSRLEHALDAAVAVGELASRVGDQVGLLAFGRQVVAMVDARTGPAQPRRILDQLFDLEPSLDAPNYTGAFAALLTRHHRRSLIVLFTDLAEESVLEPLLRAVPVLLARHLLMVASVRDPGVEALAASIPTTTDGVYDKAAAAGFLAWRERAGERLRRMGAGTVDGLPGELAGRLADEYLRIKALGRL